MKLLQILVLVVSGALVGTFVTSVWLRPHRPAMQAGTAPAATGVFHKELTPPVSLPSAAEPPRPASLTSATPQPHSSRSPARTTARKPATFRRIQMASKPTLLVLAKVALPPVSTPLPATKPAPVAEPQSATQPQASPRPSPHQVTLSTGLLIPVRLVQGLSSETSRPGDTFTATIDQEVVVDGFVIVERGTPVEGRVIAAERGSARLSVELTWLNTADRQRVAIQTESFERRQQAGESDVPGMRSAPVILPADTRIRFRLRGNILLTEKLG